MSRCKRFLSAFLAIILCVGVLPLTGMAADTYAVSDHFTKTNTYTDSVFADIRKSDWFYDNVKAVYEYSLMRGKGDGHFDPESGITLAETITIAARLHAMYYMGMDVFGGSDPWYQTYVDYAENNGIVENYISDYTIPATRGEFADILANALPDSALEEINIVAYNGIPDVSLSDSYGRSVYKLYRAGIMIGNDEIGTFAPESNIRRCEVAAIVTRLVDPALRQSVQLGEEYTVSFDLGYWGLKLDDQKVAEGYSAEKPDEPTRQNYIFEGWYTAKTGGYKFEFETEILSDMTLYARWKMDPAWFAMIMNGIVNGDKDDDDEPEEPETPDEPDEPEDDYDYGSLPYRPEKTWEELTEINGGEEPYIELNDDDQVGLYIGKISDNKVEDVYDVIAELNNVRDLLNINDARFEFIPCYEDGKIDENSYRVQQVHDGVQVWCAQVVVIVDDEGYIIGLTSSYEDSVRFSGCETEPDVTRAEAIDIAVNATEIDPEQETFTEATLVIEPEKGLVWYVTVANGNEKWWYWIDAADGDIVGKNEIGYVEATFDPAFNFNPKEFTTTTHTYKDLNNVTKTINLLKGSRFISTGSNERYWLYDDTVIPRGIRIHNANKLTVDQFKISNNPGDIISADVLTLPNEVLLHGFNTSYSFNAIAKTYEDMGFAFADHPIEVYINIDDAYGTASYGNLTKGSIRFISCNKQVAKMDYMGHEYTHFVQDYYTNAIDNSITYGDAIGKGYPDETDSNTIEYVESWAIAEGTADLMGMLIQAYNDVSLDIHDSDFLYWGESGGTPARDHTETNTVGNQTVQEMINDYNSTVTFENGKDSDGNTIYRTMTQNTYNFKKVTKKIVKWNEYGVVYNDGVGHMDGYIVVGILRHMIKNTNLTCYDYLNLWYNAISMLNPKSDFDALRAALIASAVKLGMAEYTDDIIAACDSVGIINNRKTTDSQIWYYNALARAYANNMITSDQVDNHYKNVSRQEYLDILAAMCEQVGIDTGSDAVAWAKSIKVIGETWTGSYLDQNIPRWQVTLLMFLVCNQYTDTFKAAGWHPIWHYKFVDASGKNYWDAFKEKFSGILGDWNNSAITGIDLTEMIQYYSSCAEYENGSLDAEDTYLNFQMQFMDSASSGKTYQTGLPDDDTLHAMYYTGFYHLWRNGAYRGSTLLPRLRPVDAMSLGDVCALLTWVISD